MATENQGGSQLKGKSKAFKTNWLLLRAEALRRTGYSFALKRYGAQVTPSR
jgi:hypothetical protein